MKTYKLLILALTCIVGVLTLHAAEYSPKFYCGVVKADSWTMNNNLEGIYEFDVANSTLTKLTEGQDVYQAPLGGAVYEDGVMKGIHFKTVWDAFDQANTYVLYHVQYDMDNWTRIKGVTLGDMDRNYISSCGLAHDPVTGKNYGIFYNFNMSWQVVNRKLATIDFSTNTPTRTVLGTASIPMAAIACSEAGILYGVGMDGWLYAISTANVGSGEVEVMPLGDLGIENISTNPSSMTYDKKTGKFYWSVVLTDTKSYLYEINPTIGSVAATQMMQVPDNAYLVNLFIPEAKADDEAPAAVTNLAADFADESLTGTITFHAPVTTYAGNPLSGALSYRVTANGEVVATGTVEAGADAEVAVTAPQGDVEFVVVVSNAAGDSPEAKVTAYVGPETPMPATNVVFDYNYNSKQSSVAWSAPVIGTHGRVLNVDAISYNVYRMPDAVLVGENVVDTVFREDFDPAELAPYYYSVQAMNHAVAGETAQSNKAVVGPALDVPYTNNFNTAASFDLLTVLDNNHDGVTWKWEKSFSGGGRATYYGTAERNGDEWLLSPPLNLKRGATYSITFDANTALANAVDYMDVAYGQGLHTDDYATLFDHIILNEPFATTYTNDTIVPAATGVYYFGFHCTSVQNYGWLLLHNFTVKMVSDAPAIVGDVNGDGEVDVIDINVLINIMLGNDDASNYDGRAHVTDGDTEVDIADINAVINIMLNR